MTMTDPQLEQSAARPRPGGKSSAHLVETPDGWVLTLTVDARTAVQLRKELGRGSHTNWLALREFEVSITPNLVPGAPFTVSAVEIVVE
jgi:hypothetical protein